MKTTEVASSELESVEKAFFSAVEYVRSSTTPKSLTTGQKLEAYALYKGATVGVCPPNQRPSFTKPSARAKYDAWASLGANISKEECMAKYVSLVRGITSTSPSGGNEQVRVVVTPDETVQENASDLTDLPSKCHPALSSNGASTKSYPILPPRWQCIPFLAGLACLLSYLSLWKWVAPFYVITWTASPFADWSIMLHLLQRSLSGRYGNLPLRFNLVGLSFLAWLAFVRFPLETVLWYVDEFFFPDYKSTTIKEPLFLLGQPRSGTTKLQDVLSEDEDTFCSMKLYEMRFPFLSVQYLVDICHKLDALFLGGRGLQFAENAGLLHVLPEEGERKSMRRLRYDLTDEDDTIFLFHGLCHFALTGMFPSESNAKLLYQMGDLPQESRSRYMQFHKKCVQKVMYRRGHGRRYLAKWVAGWNGLLSESKIVYPDAKYCTIIRDPKEQVPSWNKLQGLLGEQMTGVNFMQSLPKVRQAVVDINAKWYKSQIAFCRGHQNMMFLRFEDFVADIPKQTSRIYGFLGDRIMPGSVFEKSLQSIARKQLHHKKTSIRSHEQFVSEEEIKASFPHPWEELFGRNEEVNGKASTGPPQDILQQLSPRKSVQFANSLTNRTGPMSQTAPCACCLPVCFCRSA